MNTKTIKKCVAILLFAMLTMPAFSQLRFGVRADVGLNTPSFSTEVFEVENLTSFSIGPTVEFMLPIVGFGIETALLYNNHRMNISGSDVRGDYKVTNHYLLLPVNAKKKFGLGVLPAQLFATAGPYVGFLLSGDEFRITEIQEGISARSFQAGIGLGFGVEVLRRLQVGVQYRLQLTENYDVNESVLRNVINPLNERTSTWNLSATFFF